MCGASSRRQARSSRDSNWQSPGPRRDPGSGIRRRRRRRHAGPGRGSPGRSRGLPRPERQRRARHWRARPDDGRRRRVSVHGCSAQCLQSQGSCPHRLRATAPSAGSDYYYGSGTTQRTNGNWSRSIATTARSPASAARSLCPCGDGGHQRRCPVRHQRQRKRVLLGQSGHRRHDADRACRLPVGLRTGVRKATDTIYGLGRNRSSDTVYRLLTFDRVTGVATAIGPGTSGLKGPAVWHSIPCRAECWPTTTTTRTSTPSIPARATPRS